MSDDTIAIVRAACDQALACIDATARRINAELRKATTVGPRRIKLEQELEDLRAEERRLLEAAKDALLRDPRILAAAATLEGLAAETKKVANKLPAVTMALETTQSVLNGVKALTDEIVALRKPA